MKRFYVLITALMMMAMLYGAEEQVVQFQTGTDHLLKPEQVNILKENVLDNGYSLSFQRVTDAKGVYQGDKYTMAKVLPSDTPPISKLATLALLGAALLEHPQDQQLAKGIEKLSSDFINNGGPKEPGDPDNMMDVAKGYQLIAILAQIADFPPVNINSTENPFIPWAEFMIWAQTNNLQRNSYPGHKWKLDKDQVPRLYLPNGSQSFVKLSEEGIDPPTTHVMPTDWSYTKDGFVKGKGSPVIDKP